MIRNVQKVIAYVLYSVIFVAAAFAIYTVVFDVLNNIPIAPGYEYK
jgi:hypothetical protein